jgi:hypothetical protein
VLDVIKAFSAGSQPKVLHSNAVRVMIETRVSALLDDLIPDR